MMQHDDVTAAADRASRHFTGDEGGPIAIGSDRHKALFSRLLLDTFNPYKPAVIDWPRLEPEARERLVSLPIWDIAVQTEGKASLNVREQGAAEIVGYLALDDDQVVVDLDDAEETLLDYRDTRDPADVEITKRARLPKATVRRR